MLLSRTLRACRADCPQQAPVSAAGELARAGRRAGDQISALRGERLVLDLVSSIMGCHPGRRNGKKEVG